MILGIALPSGSAGFSLNYSIGFNGHFQLNNWTPLSVVLENRDRATSGKLEVIVTSGSEYKGDVYRTIYAADADLPQNSKKRYAFTIIIKSFTHGLIIRLRQDDDILFSKTINLRSHYSEKYLAVVADNFMAPDILSVMPSHLYPVSVRPQYLPETWYGYNSVKLLILHADTIRQLRDRQFQALSQWLKQGGYLTIGTGLNYGALRDQRLQDMLPIRVGGHRRFFELKSLGQFCNRELNGIEPFLVLNARIDDSKILVKENDIPIIAQKSHGFGQIVFLSFDFNSPPFSRWDGRRMFWNKILALEPKLDRPMVELDDQQIVNSMLAGIPLKMPQFRSVFVFVGAYLISLWFLLKKIKKPGKGRLQFSLCFLILIILFSSVGLRGLNDPNLKQKFTYNSFCQLDIADPAMPVAAKYFIGLYSLIKLGYGVNFGPTVYPVTHIISERSTSKLPNPYALQKKDSGQQIIGSMQRWSHSFYKLDLYVTSPLAGYARRDPSFMTLMVENKGPHNFVDCLIYYKKRFIFVEDILARNRQTIRLNLAELKKKEIFGEHEVKTILRRFDGNGSVSYLRKAQQHLASDLLLAIHKRYKANPDSLVLVAWMQTGLIQPKFNPPNPSGAGITVINWELPVETTL
jgi:hypothetical protein